MEEILEVGEKLHDLYEVEFVFEGIYNESVLKINTLGGCLDFWYDPDADAYVLSDQYVSYGEATGSTDEIVETVDRLIHDYLETVEAEREGSR